MIGMDASTGKALGGDEHIRQSIHDIIMTSRQTRVLRRDYGSDVYDLLDKPMTQANLASVFAAVIEAVNAYEPRIELVQVSADESLITAGKLSLHLSGFRRSDGQAFTIRGLKIT